MTAAKALNKYPENIHFQGRHSRVYCGLNNKEMFWLASRYKITTALSHHISLVNEVVYSNQTREI